MPTPSSNFPIFDRCSRYTIHNDTNANIERAYYGKLDQQGLLVLGAGETASHTCALGPASLLAMRGSTFAVKRAQLVGTPSKASVAALPMSDNVVGIRRKVKR